jgi:hypothetical protein
LQIKLNKRVENVQWNERWGGRERAVVRCEDGEELKADYVIVTLPLGVLKCNHERMFCPQLPCPKAKAIGRLGFGNLTRIYLRYEKPFWCRGGGRLRFALDQDLWPGGVCPLDEVSGDHVLCFTLGGTSATQAEKHTDPILAQLLTQFIRRALDDPALPPPIAITRYLLLIITLVSLHQVPLPKYISFIPIGKSIRGDLLMIICRGMFNR